MIDTKRIASAVRSLQYASNDTDSIEARQSIGTVIRLLREMHAMGLGDLAEAIGNDWTNAAYDAVDQAIDLSRGEVAA